MIEIITIVGIVQTVVGILQGDRVIPGQTMVEIKTFVGILQGDRIAPR